ncbi:spermidine synthase [Capnocytophaga sp.]|uniref:spermidine synthase n=1 Tax=Capnocytophaga sp. TaxID=44737 RepID=UPI0026DC6D0C|nr:fused MFS/spermidine synthase [Capnocytophaga sp.]MDO5106265.1 fused MFS/spermidine synthase [Capnocytophaga sp.]
MIKKWLSYLFPISVHKQKSLINKSIDVAFRNGRLVLDTPNTNYSYGSLQRILRLGLRQIGFPQVRAMKHILVLGLAGGSVVKTLVDEIGYTGKITAVDIDAEIVNLACNYFKINEIPNLKIKIADAQEFVKKEKSAYDLIIIDIFQDDTMPDFLFTTEFINHIFSLMTPNGIILFNTMKISELHSERNSKFAAYCRQTHQVKILSNIEGSNELIFISKSDFTS